MSEQTATIASLCVSTLQSLIVFAANFLTIAVFWIHRNKLRRTSLLTSNQFGRSRSSRRIRIRDTIFDGVSTS